MLLDDITGSIQRYFEVNFNLYPIERCPICGKVPEVKYYKNYDVFDISCRPLFSRTSHFYVFGSSGESKKSVVGRWNKKVVQYETFNKNNPAESVLRRFV